jgi:hypothetical protein
MNSGEVMVGGKRRQVQEQEQGQPSLKLQKHKQKHLYLVLDDWDEGFTIRKIDADGPDLNEPPVLRLVSPAPRFRMFFTSMGSHILAVSNQHPVTLAYNTDTQGLAAGPFLPDALLGGHDIFLPAADKLFAFGRSLKEGPQSVEVMSSSADKHLCSSLIPSKDWSWRSVVPSPFTEDERICSYAAHPDGCTVFVSSHFIRTRDHRCRTFSFNMSNCEWMCHGDWELPFEDQGYFNSDLDAWVGLHQDGYIGACQVASPSSSSSSAGQLNWKMAKDKLWNCEGPREPTLTSMGNARFCLVDSVEGNESDDGCMLQITTFRLRYSREGELQIIDRNTSSCPVSKHNYSFSPVAFWM